MQIEKNIFNILSIIYKNKLYLYNNDFLNQNQKICFKYLNSSNKFIYLMC